MRRLERAAGCTGASKEMVPKIQFPCCSHCLGMETPEEEQGDSSCTESGKFGVGAVTQNQRGFPFPVGLMRTAGEEKASNSNSSDLSKGRGAPLGEAVMGRGELRTGWRAMPSASFPSQGWYPSHSAILDLHPTLILCVVTRVKNRFVSCIKKDWILLNCRKY